MQSKKTLQLKCYWKIEKSTCVVRLFIFFLILF